MTKRAAILRRVAASLALAATLLAGCQTVGPRYRGPPATAVINDPKAQGPFVSAQGPAFSPDPASGEWWRIYDDPQLNGMIKRAMSANTDLRVALGSGEAERLYKGGRVDFLIYLDAQRALAAAESAVAASDVRVSADQIAIFLALGGGWEDDPRPS